MLYRVFPSLPGAAPTAPGGALFVPRAFQGQGRHDHPDRYGALYAARSPVSAVAERLAAFGQQTLDPADLTRADGAVLALAEIDETGVTAVVDLDDPAELVARSLRPSRVATHDRAVTQGIALAMFEEGLAGFAWWSALEASWSNVTMFAERAVPSLRVAVAPVPLTLDAAAVREAADALGISLAG